jgi:hypothetical protein
MLNPVCSIIILKVHEIVNLHILEMYSVVCTVRAGVKSAVQALPMLTDANGETFFCFSYRIELLFGLTEYKAQIRWQENVGACLCAFDRMLHRR